MEDHLAKALNNNIQKIKMTAQDCQNAKQFNWAQYRQFKPGDMCRIMSRVYRIKALSSKEIVLEDGEKEITFRNPHSIPQDEIDQIFEERAAGITREEICRKHKINSSGIDQILYMMKHESKPIDSQAGRIVTVAGGKNIAIGDDDDDEIPPIRISPAPIDATAPQITIPPVIKKQAVTADSVMVPRSLALTIHRDLFYLRFYRQIIQPGLDEALSDLGKILQP